ncbi:sugar kinase [Fangia hongkongensis]|nr:sugar kinase [Fangia hongkongensis]
MQGNLLVIGECMLEISGSLFFHQACQLNYGGDVLNTAVYYRRLTEHDTAFLTALGKDALSHQMMRSFENEKINTSPIIQIDHALPGLYAIQTDSMGERSFHYWRENAPVKSLFLHTSDSQLNALSQSYPDIYLSGISLSRWDEKQLEILTQWLLKHKSDAINRPRIIFDLNYRPKCWTSPHKAQTVLQKFLPLCDLVISTFDDEALLFNDKDPNETLVRYQSYGIQHIVIKQGPLPTFCYQDGELLLISPDQKIERPVDTTAAGDSFNASYLAALSYGLNMELACRFAQSFAAEIIQHQGAIIDKNTTDQYRHKLQQYSKES